MKPLTFLYAPLSALLMLSATTYANPSSDFASKVTKNCGFQPAMANTLRSTFNAEELRVLNIAQTGDDEVCRQTVGFVTASHKPSRKESHAFVRKIYQTHQELMDEADSLD